MFNIGSFFEKFQNTATKELAFRNAAKAVIRRTTSLEIPMEAINIKGGVIYLKGLDHSAKSEVFMKKQAIIDGINSSQGVYKVKDLRY